MFSATWDLASYSTRTLPAHAHGGPVGAAQSGRCCTAWRWWAGRRRLACPSTPRQPGLQRPNLGCLPAWQLPGMAARPSNWLVLRMGRAVAGWLATLLGLLRLCVLEAAGTRGLPSRPARHPVVRRLAACKQGQWPAPSLRSLKAAHGYTAACRLARAVGLGGCSSTKSAFAARAGPTVPALPVVRPWRLKQ